MEAEKEAETAGSAAAAAAVEAAREVEAEARRAEAEAAREAARRETALKMKYDAQKVDTPPQLPQQRGREGAGQGQVPASKKLSFNDDPN